MVRTRGLTSYTAKAKSSTEQDGAALDVGYGFIC